jgi:hypothetical protein
LIHAVNSAPRLSFIDMHLRRASHGHVSHGRLSYRRHLYLISVYLTGVHLMGAYLINVHLIERCGELEMAASAKARLTFRIGLCRTSMASVQQRQATSTVATANSNSGNQESASTLISKTASAGVWKV